MARERSPDRDRAFEMWKESNGEMKLKDIADSLKVSEGTVRGWKNKDKWDDHLKGTFQKNKRNAPKETERSKPKKEERKVTQETKFEDVTEDLGLTPNQRKFVYEYTIDFNATQAAIRAGYSEKTAMEQGYQLLQKTLVKTAVEKLLSQRLVTIDVRANDIVEQYKKIAFADLSDFVTWRSERFVVGQDEETGETINDIVTRIELKSSSEVDGTVISEISETQGKFGPTHSIKLNDRMKALDALSKHINLFVDRDKRRIEELKLQLELEKVKMAREKLILEKAKIMGDPDEETEDDGLLDSLNNTASEVWDDHSEES